MKSLGHKTQDWKRLMSKLIGSSLGLRIDGAGCDGKDGRIVVGKGGGEISRQLGIARTMRAGELRVADKVSAIQATPDFVTTNRRFYPVFRYCVCHLNPLSLRKKEPLLR